MRRCRECGAGVEAAFRFCPFCATPQRAKIVEFFLPHPAVVGDGHKALRVSRYFATAENPPHVRFSIWNGERVEAAVSLTESEAARLGRFVSPPPGRRRVLDELRASLRL